WGNYNCTWNSTGRKEGNWSINLTSDDTQHKYYQNKTTFADWFWLENIEPSYNYSEMKVEPSQESWTIAFNYSVPISDEENDTTNCTLWVTTDGNKDNAVNKGMDTLADGNGNCSVLVHDFTRQDFYNNDNWFWFEIRDEGGNAYNTTNKSDPVFEKANTTIEHIAGDGEEVNITDDNVLLRVFVNDTDNESAAYNVSVNFTVEKNSSYLDTIMNKTDQSGYASYYLDPDCSYTPGNRTWYANITDDAYQQQNTSNFSVIVKGHLNITWVSPDWYEVMRGSNVTMQVKITDNWQSDTCGNNITDANLTIRMESVKTGQNFSCDNIIHVGNGYYNCTFNTTENPGVMDAKNYTVYVNASREYYNPHNISEVAFFIETEPYLTLLTSPPDSYNTSDSVNPGGWGENWYFYVNLTNEDGDLVMVRLWVKLNTTGDWGSYRYQIQLNNESAIIRSTNPWPFDSKSRDDRSGYNFKWNVSDDDDWVAKNETNVTNFTVTDDDVAFIYVSGDNSTVNRSIAPSQSNVTFDVQVNDTDRGLIRDLGDGNFYVTSNEDTYAISEAEYVWVLDDTKSMTSEHLINTFPFADRCNYRIGPQKWKVEYEYDGWFTTNSSLFNVNLTTNPLEVYLQLPETNKTMRKGMDSLLIRGNVTDDCIGSNHTANATINFTVPQQNYFCTAVNDEEDGWYNCTIPVSAPVTGDWGYNYYNLTMNASKRYYNSSSTLNKQDAFILVSNPEIRQLTIDSVCAWPDLNGSCSDFSWGELWRFNASIRDQDHAGPLGEHLNISLYVNVSGGWKFLNSTDETGLGTWTDVEITYHDFNCSDLGSRMFIFNITDIYSYYNSSNASETMQKDNVYIYLEADPASIDREGSNTGEFRVRVRDLDNDTYENVGVNVSFWFSPDNNFDEYDSGRLNQTYSGGYARYNFDPNCNYQTGQQFWMAGVSNDGCYYDENFTDPPYNPASRQFDIIGQLKNWIVTPNWTAGQPQFNVTDQIPVEFNVTSECSNQPTENPISGVTRSLELQAPNASWESSYSPDEYQSGFYNYTWNSTSKDEGNWSIRVNTSMTDYNPNSTYLSNWFWLENIPPENVTSPLVNPSSDGWTRWFNFTIEINDPENDTTNCTLWVST
ncbi:MAG: hypothetical protein KAW40_01355, partial [Candidatus Aenigmarchaeota archaeon]|nr:hypothetical protein [Candidatus Aenigmarchaeota archaeon]